MIRTVAVAGAFALAAALAIAAVGGAAADERGLIVKESAHGVAETVDRLERLLEEKGITVVARVDHAAAASDAEEGLLPTEVLLFGNPALGTPLMRSSRTVGIDLPMKALVWEDEEGTVRLAYNDPAWLIARHRIEGQIEVAGRMNETLEELTNAAISE